MLVVLLSSFMDQGLVKGRSFCTLALVIALTISFLGKIEAFHRWTLETLERLEN